MLALPGSSKHQLQTPDPRESQPLMTDSPPQLCACAGGGSARLLAGAGDCTDRKNKKLARELSCHHEM